MRVSNGQFSLNPTTKVILSLEFQGMTSPSWHWFFIAKPNWSSRSSSSEEIKVTCHSYIYIYIYTLRIIGPSKKEGFGCV